MPDACRNSRSPDASAANLGSLGRHPADIAGGTRAALCCHLRERAWIERVGTVRVTAAGGLRECVGPGG
ncbi:hypothetical protein TH66_05735 [Carbonactinospora thermoautotrophica]|uniref:Uncharacterized protein n=1 Tax=Carbonactinospora thermoautotrophica TaxID=1469144 RepID=A0A132N5F3_9ACTN|nr:hypothetical protein [Carbonactinospora thermoautotrophica]KWX01012.1 hypothetical protein LI90_2040 [Carbonactinospora thermoautotrophica]KWX04705.1 hypothetical protein TH66_05735 [Carbonactinospora thermoautotrophica]KWX05217.1 hypothetical protein TR74_23960 [Carbonactinospora thermoautotrophica]